MCRSIFAHQLLEKLNKVKKKILSGHVERIYDHEKLKKDVALASLVGRGWKARQKWHEYEM